MPTWHAFALVPDENSCRTPEVPIPTDLGNDVQLVEIPDWLRTAPYPGGSVWGVIDYELERPQLALYRRFEAEDPDKPSPEWQGPDTITHWEFCHQRLALANLAVWLVRPGSTLRFRYLLDVGESSGARMILHLAVPLPLWAGRTPERLVSKDLGEARDLDTALAAVEPSSPLWMAARSLWGALTERWFHNRYVLAWIVLEALFGPRDPGEVAHRLASNLALFLKTDSEERRQLYRQAKSDYGVRSRVVHGEGAGIAPPQWGALMHRAEDWIRLALVQILKDPNLRASFATSAKRDDFFEAFAFTALWPDR